MKKKLLAMLDKKNARKLEINSLVEASNDVEELRTLSTELDALNTEIRNLQEMIDNLPEEPTPQSQRTQAVTGDIPGAVSSSAAGQETRGSAPAIPHDPFGTMEYRNAFMQFCKTGKITEEFRKMQPEFRLDAMTTVTEVSAIIPSTILKEIIKEAKIYGQIFSRIRLLNIKGGVTVPILTLKPTATRIGEAAPSDKKKVTVNTNVSFSYYGLECKVATSLLAETVTLEGFESLVKDLIGEAMIIAIETEIISGNGTGRCLGITADPRVPAGNKVTLTADEISAWDAWKKKVFATMPLAYKAGATFLMASGTWEGYIDGMVDANGQPIGRTNYGITDGPAERFGGKEVIQVEDDLIVPFDEAEDGDVIAIYCNLKNYAVNSNLQMSMYRYFDHDTNEWIDKAILINDGKLLDPNGVIIIYKEGDE
ncbi:phage major capsid protein [Bacteroides sp.]|uniref:phage major capsid protein n=1 Tax=Bacteroides sp. TaxID=29523 RepID=UPI002618E5C2|nr:phage major capsid protein [Bacteroides sp.]MDD3040782.1 phage major capsid protein [Bacteroides sp.]